MTNELDARIAIEIMGYLGKGEQGVWIPKSGNLPGHYFSPSSIEDDAGKVQSRLVASGLMITVYTGIYCAQGVKCRCCIMRGPHDLDSGGIAVVADTRPLAICKAALEAKARGWIE